MEETNKEINYIREIIRLIRYHYDHDEDAFRNVCWELCRHFDKIGRDQLSEYIACIVTGCGWVPM